MQKKYAQCRRAKWAMHLSMVCIRSEQSHPQGEEVTARPHHAKTPMLYRSPSSHRLCAGQCHARM